MNGRFIALIMGNLAHLRERTVSFRLFNKLQNDFEGGDGTLSERKNHQLFISLGEFVCLDKFHVHNEYCLLLLKDSVPAFVWIDTSLYLQ